MYSVSNVTVLIVVAAVEISLLIGLNLYKEIKG
jgi:hypothetical protein